MSMPATIQEALNDAGKKLAARTDSPALEAAVLLAHLLGLTRAQLYTRHQQTLAETQRRDFFALIARRLDGEPLAYITGRREFWSLDLIVDPHTLIPRPETELLVEQALALIPAQAPFRVLDLGTGSGAIALAVAAERPHSLITATDLSPLALEVARANAARIGVTNVVFREGSWFAPFDDERFDIILSNPPYVAEGDPHLAEGDLPAEPRLALVAGPTGLEMLADIVGQATHHMNAGGWLLLEHGYDQGTNVAALMARHQYRNVRTRRDAANIERVTLGQAQ